MKLDTKIELINSKHVELLGKETVLMANICIDVTQIETVSETTNDDLDEIDPNRCGIYMRSGEYYKVYTPYLEVKKLWMSL